MSGNPTNRELSGFHIIRVITSTQTKQSTIPHMLPESKARWMAIVGYALAGLGIALYTQLDRIVESRSGRNVVDIAALSSVAATFVGFLVAIVGSVIWARRSSTRRPLKIAFLVGVGSFLLCLGVDVNVHGPSAILIFLAPFSVANFLSVLVVTRW